MKVIYEELTLRIRSEINDLDRIVHRALRAWAQARKAQTDQDIYLDSTALNLHGFYSGIERLFELIARHIDRSIPQEEVWHRDLLYQMSHDFLDIRPSVIGQENALHLDEFRRFRHLVRNVYTTNLAPDKMLGLMSTLPTLWKSLGTELLAFAAFIEELAKASGKQSV